MDFKELFETVFTYDEEKPWSILIPQLLFYCFRNYCLKKVINDISSNTVEWDSLYELCTMNCDENFKLYIPDFFEPNVFEHVEDPELIELFFKNFIISFNIILLNPDDKLEEKFTQFLDKDLFIFFNDIIINKEYLIFPISVEGELDDQKYLHLRSTKLNYSLEINTEELDTPISNEKTEINTLHRALIYKKNLQNRTLRKKQVPLSQTRKNTTK
jgi:hypothetical protein